LENPMLQYSSTPFFRTKREVTMIRITSKQHNFRRCRVAHPKGTTEYPDDKFSPEQIKVLEAEPKLTVEIVEDGSSAADPPSEAELLRRMGAPEDGERPDLTVRELKKRLEEMEVEFPPKAKKEELQELLADKMIETVVPE